MSGTGLLKVSPDNKHAAGGRLLGGDCWGRYCEMHLLIGHDRGAGVPGAGLEANTWLGKGGVCRRGVFSGLRAPQEETHLSPQVRDPD